MVFKICGKDLDPSCNHTESSTKDQDESTTEGDSCYLFKISIPYHTALAADVN